MDKSFFKDIAKDFCEEFNVSPTDEALDEIAAGLEKLYASGWNDAWRDCYNAIINVKGGGKKNEVPFKKSVY